MKSSPSPSRLNLLRAPLFLPLCFCLLAVASANANNLPGFQNGNGPGNNPIDFNPPGGTHNVPEGGLGLLGCGLLVAGLAAAQLRKSKASKQSD